jgi:hypothetical protein
MSEEAERRVLLSPHTTTPCDAVRRVGVSVVREPDGALKLAYSMDADLTRLGLPLARTRPARRLDGLWRHTCFEAFIALHDDDAYHEFNFAPSGDWAAYDFSGYREGMVQSPMLHAPRIETAREQEGFALTATVAAATGARLALAAVIEEHGGRLSYWALRHPGDKPDFHHRDGFILEI